MLGTLRPMAERAAGIMRHTTRRAERLGRHVGSDAAGMVARVRNRNPAPKPLDDVTLARKVETKLFRPADAPKGKVDVDVANGIVTLCGEVKNPKQKASLQRAAEAIPEVQGVENLLKLPKTPSPTRADSPGKSRRTGGRKPSAARSRPAAKKATGSLRDR